MHNQEADNDPINEALKKIIQTLKQADEQIRERMLPIWRMADYRWRGYNTVFWNDTARDWQVPTRADCELLNIDYESLNHSVNIYRAYGESVIGALSSAVPSVKFFPGDADSADDVATARAFSKIDKLLDKQNNSPLLLIRMLFTMWRQPFAALYIHPEENEKYGTYKKPIYEPQMVEETVFECADCGDYPDPDVDEACPNCKGQNIFDYQGEVERVVVVGYNDEPKSRIHIEVFGPLQVRVPYYARNLECASYVGLETEEAVSYLQDLYPDHHIVGDPGDETFNKWARSPLESLGEINKDTTTWGRWWLPPSSFWALGYDNREEVEQLKQMFPKGAYVCIIGGKVVDRRAENLHDRWIITEDPTSDHIHADPLGHPVENIQEMTDEVLDLEMQTMEYGIPQTFADPSVLNFKKFSETEVKVGQVFPAEAKPGATLEHGFFTTKTATLSPEVSQIGQKLQAMGQLVSRAQPQIYGGRSGNDTLGQDQQARQDALQRLGIIWKIIVTAWKQAKAVACVNFRNHIQEDEKIVEASGDGFVNTWIRLSELRGEISVIDSEVSEQFPISWAQQRDILLQLLGLNRPPIDMALFSPSNISYINTLLGLNDLKIPGESDRLNQLRDIVDLLKSGPLPPVPIMGPDQMPMIDPTSDPMMPQPMMGPPQPTISVDSRIANIPVRLEAIKEWANSDAGYLAKMENPEGFANVMAQFDQMLGMLPPPVMQEEPVKENNNGKGLSTPAKDDLSVDSPESINA